MRITIYYYWKAGVAGREMESHSTFLNWLNGNNNCADLQYGTYDRDKFNSSVHYYIIGSHAPLPLTISHSHTPCLCVLGYDFLWYSFTSDGDGLTADNSLKLTGVSSNDIAIIPDVWHSDAPPLMTDQMDSIDVINRAVSDIRGDASSSATNVALASETTGNVATQLSSSAQGVIKPNEVKTQTAFIDSTTKKAYFDLFWPGSGMDDIPQNV